MEPHSIPRFFFIKLPKYICNVIDTINELEKEKKIWNNNKEGTTNKRVTCIVARGKLCRRKCEGRLGIKKNEDINCRLFSKKRVRNSYATKQ